MEVYVADVYGEMWGGVKEVKGLGGVGVKKGERENVEFVVDEDDLKYYNCGVEYGYEGGEFEVMVGGERGNVEEGSFVGE